MKHTIKAIVFVGKVRGPKAILAPSLQKVRGPVAPSVNMVPPSLERVNNLILIIFKIQVMLT